MSNKLREGFSEIRSLGKQEANIRAYFAGEAAKRKREGVNWEAGPEAVAGTGLLRSI